MRDNFLEKYHKGKEVSQNIYCKKCNGNTWKQIYTFGIGHSHMECKGCGERRIPENEEKIIILSIQKPNE